MSVVYKNISFKTTILLFFLIQITHQRSTQKMRAPESNKPAANSKPPSKKSWRKAFKDVTAGVKDVKAPSKSIWKSTLSFLKKQFLQIKTVLIMFMMVLPFILYCQFLRTCLIEICKYGGNWVIEYQ